MNMVIATKHDAKAIARIISTSNKDVAETFGLNLSNNPKHPSFCTEDWVLSDFVRGETYFLYQIEGTNAGCVAFENPRPGVAYLNRLSVLPEFRRNGIGEALVKQIIQYASTKDVHRISIGLIAEHTELMNWYRKLGFVSGETKTFPHLPFAVHYMNYKIV